MTTHNFSKAMDLDATAQALDQARRQRTSLEAMPLPSSIDEAYALQAAIARLQPGAPVAWKVGATTTAALEFLALAEPFHGPLFSDWHHISEGDGFELEIGDGELGVEAEFVLFFKDDIAAQEGEKRAELIKRIREAVVAVAPGFELVGARFDRDKTPDGNAVIADFAGSVATIVGKPLPLPKDMPGKAHPVSLSINGKEAASGNSEANCENGLFDMVAWLLEHETMFERGLKAGEFLYTGSCTGVTPVKAGDKVTADFGALGSIKLELTSS